MDRNGEFCMTVKLYSDDKIAETSSKGNQEKWLDSNRWYKLDQFGYEALAETLISKLLEMSNIQTDTEFQFVHYQMEKLYVHGRERTGCSSENFLKQNHSIITLSHLFRREFSEPLKKQLGKLSSDKKRIAYLANTTAELTGLKKFPQYLTLLFEIDSLFLNDDRHLNNIAVIDCGDHFDYCPIFDNGAGLLSNTMIAPMDIEPKALIRSAKARPFNTTFNRQAGTACNLYGKQLEIPQFSKSQIQKLVEPLLLYYPERDRGIVFDRISTCIQIRQRVKK